MAEALTQMNRSSGNAGISLATPLDYFSLLKPRVMSLVIFTALTGMLMSPSQSHPVLQIISLLCIAIGAGASGALNMWYDADIDKVMARTSQRAIPAGKISGQEVLIFGIILSSLSVVTLWLASNWQAAALLAFTIFFYAVIYTIGLKRYTAQNIVIGGAAGALPPVVGWLAASGELSVMPWVLFLIIFLWTPPHFWSLALVRSQDYERARIPMLPNVAGVKSTKVQIILYSLALVLATLAPFLMGEVGWLYFAAALSLGTSFIVLATQLLIERNAEKEKKKALQLFSFSILYLFILFAVLLSYGVINV